MAKGGFLSKRRTAPSHDATTAPDARPPKQRVTYADLVNPPIKFRDGDWFANERLMELPFVHHVVPLDGRGKRALEFGCTRSDLALQLAGQGYEVTGIDLRSYAFHHPHLDARMMDLLDLPSDRAFDVITCVSVIEHVGLGAYGEPPDEDALRGIAGKLAGLLAPGGRLVLTTPVGRANVDPFMRSFPPAEVRRLFEPPLTLEQARYFARSDHKHWRPCSEAEIGEISNHESDRGPTGVNGVGCFLWRAPA